MDSLVKTLIDGLHSDKVLPHKMLSELNVDEYLDKREADAEWYRKWSEMYSKVEDIQDESVPGFEELHELVFEKCSEYAGIGDLSCYTAEDFELLVKAKFAGEDNEWTRKLLATYLRGELP